MPTHRAILQSWRSPYLLLELRKGSLGWAQLGTRRLFLERIGGVWHRKLNPAAKPHAWKKEEFFGSLVRSVLGAPQFPMGTVRTGRVVPTKIRYSSALVPIYECWGEIVKCMPPFANELRLWTSGCLVYLQWEPSGNKRCQESGSAWQYPRRDLGPERER